MAFYPSDGDNHADMAVTVLLHIFVEMFLLSSKLLQQLGLFLYQTSKLRLFFIFVEYIGEVPSPYKLQVWGK